MKTQDNAHKKKVCHEIMSRCWKLHVGKSCNGLATKPGDQEALHKQSRMPLCRGKEREGDVVKTPWMSDIKEWIGKCIVA